jgi:hypothetical protein
VTLAFISPLFFGDLDHGFFKMPIMDGVRKKKFKKPI